MHSFSIAVDGEKTAAAIAKYAAACMAWMREPIGNSQRQTLAEMWSGSALDALRREFEADQPGVDCLHCVVRKKTPSDTDDFFYQKLAKPFSQTERESAA